MNTRKIALTLAAMVFAWSMAMAAMGHAALIASLAPVLGLTVNQVLRGLRSPTAPVSGYRGATVSHKEDGAP
ncbi:hypothetical protein [Streptomyces sp. bgisy100]|uniref:hypothetical protein n=1 Tax=Streptomyces sp. bgisy100 TaxID=3413783 RepID=UPI003D730D2E